jgi:membrane protease YdiL (CAAX protease family)
MEPRKLIIILFFCLVVRMYFVLFMNRYFDEYYVGLAGQTVFNLSIFGFSCYLFKLNRPKIRAIFGRVNLYEVYGGICLGLLLLMFTYGESAVTTLSFAHFNLSKAYEAGRFHEEFYGAMPFFSIHVFTYILTAVCMPAVFEEFFFRGLLFPAFASKYSRLKSAVICSAIFTLLHFMKPIHINTFVFAFVLCAVYARGGSLYIAIVAHAIYNFFAFVSHYYVNVHGTRSIRDISSVSDWVPELTMLTISLLVFSALAYRHRKFLLSCLEKPDKTVPII